jgi:hypothetical protein
MNGWCKIKKGAEYAGVSDRTFEDWLKQGMNFVRLPSGTRLIKFQWIDEFLEGFTEKENKADIIANKILKNF